MIMFEDVTCFKIRSSLKSTTSAKAKKNLNKVNKKKGK